MSANNRLDPKHKNRLSPKANGAKNPLSSITAPKGKTPDQKKNAAILAAFKKAR